MAHKYLEELDRIAKNDVEALKASQKNYGDSWCRRGGIGAYMIMIRKFDRLDNYMPNFNYDIFKAINDDSRKENVLNDIQDARRYLMLIEAYVLANEAIDSQDKTGQEHPFGYDVVEDTVDGC